MLGGKAFGGTHIAVFCDECKQVTYLWESEVMDLQKNDLWGGDWLCDSCWDVAPDTQDSPLQPELGEEIWILDLESTHKVYAPANLREQEIVQQRWLRIKGDAF